VLEHKKEVLDQHLKEKKAKGAQIRCREKWVEYGEKNNSYFLGLEKQRQIKKSINKLIDENNEIIIFSKTFFKRYART
jgi:hypothetical protein